jgi:hypothetical protein
MVGVSTGNVVLESRIFSRIRVAAWMDSHYRV